MSEPLTHTKIATRAGHALAKIDHMGQRGITMVTYAEVEALAIVAVLAGIQPLPLDQEITETPEGESHVED